MKHFVHVRRVFHHFALIFSVKLGQKNRYVEQVLNSKIWPTRDILETACSIS